MARYIDADVILAKFDKTLQLAGNDGAIAALKFCKKIVQKAPTISPDEVRGVGYNKLNEYHTLFQCSVCGWEDDDTITGSGETNTYNYCPNCGAKMEVSEDA